MMTQKKERERQRISEVSDLPPREPFARLPPLASIK